MNQDNTAYLMSIPNGTPIKAMYAGLINKNGRVYGHYRNRWGCYLRIKFDDNTFDTCHSIITDGPISQIGWHLGFVPNKRSTK